VREFAPRASAALTAADAQCGDVFREHPFYDPPDLAGALRRLVESAEFRQATDLA
jgi:hypothetical protein